MTKRKGVLTPAQIESKLIAAGIHPTRPRIAICRFVLCEADHPTAEDVRKWIESVSGSASAGARVQRMSLATVYNTLGVLVAAGLLQEFRLPHHPSVIYDSNTSPHFHFLDEKTRRLYDMPLESIDAPRVKRGFRVSSMDLLVRGTVG